jgi:prophage regulatory protein
MDVRAIGWPEVLAMLPVLSKSTIEEEIRQGRFPKPRQLSGRRVGWLVSEIDAWLDSRPASDLPPPENTNAKKPRIGRLAAQASHQVS